MNYLWTNTETSTVLVQELQRNGDHSKDGDHPMDSDHYKYYLLPRKKFLKVALNLTTS